MRLLQIQYFLTIADTGSITKAANQLYISQPALSKQMRLLEEELGVTLIQRLPQGVALTPVGEEFARDMRKVMADLDMAIKKASYSAISKVIRIGCFDGAIIEDFMPDLYKNLRSVDPELQIKLSRNSIRKNHEALVNDDIDLLIEIHFPDPENSSVSARQGLKPVADDHHNDNAVKQSGKNNIKTDIIKSNAADDQYKNSAAGDFCERLILHRKGALIYSVNSPLAQIEHLVPADFENETFFIPNRKEDLHLATHGIEVLKTIGIQNPKTESMDNLMSMMTNIKLGLGYSVLAEVVAKYNPGLLAYTLPDPLGMDVVAIWKKSNKQVTALMDALP